MTHTELALKLFGEKFHCSQAVLAAFASELGLTEDQALRLGACFGTGMQGRGVRCLHRRADGAGHEVRTVRCRRP